jgi:hypothetical protein
MNARRAPLLAVLSTIFVGVAMLTASPAPATGATTGQEAAAAPSDSVFRFVSSPDLFNGDIADVRRGNTFWEPGDPNSWNSSFKASIDNAFDEFRRFAPEAFLMAGDAVQGHWGKDVRRTGIFGPVDTDKAKVRALHRAANLYYGAWRRNFTDHGLPLSTVHAAVGDHEIGDNPWPAGRFKYQAFDDFKEAWSRHFTDTWGGGNRYAMHPRGTAFDDTAYAQWLHPDLLLVTVDVFARDRSGVHARVAGAQLRWLREVLAGVPESAQVIVQGHVPVLSPVRTRGSSGLRMEGGRSSRFWQTLNEFGVDAYLCGEVHAVTVSQEAPGRTVQIAHGGLLSWGSTNFLVGDLLEDGSLSLQLRVMGATVDKTRHLWQTAGRIAKSVRLDQGSSSGGTLVLRDRVVLAESGRLVRYPEVD